MYWCSFVYFLHVCRLCIPVMNKLTSDDQREKPYHYTYIFNFEQLIEMIAYDYKIGVFDWGVSTHENNYSYRVFVIVGKGRSKRFSLPERLRTSGVWADIVASILKPVVGLPQGLMLNLWLWEPEIFEGIYIKAFIDYNIVESGT